MPLYSQACLAASCHQLLRNPTSCAPTPHLPKNPASPPIAAHLIPSPQYSPPLLYINSRGSFYAHRHPVVPELLLLLLRLPLQPQNRHRRQPRLHRPPLARPQRHRKLQNSRRKMLGHVLLEPHRPPPNRADDSPRHGPHRSHPPIQRLRLHHVLHHLRHQPIHLGADGPQAPLLGHLQSHRRRSLLRRPLAHVRQLPQRPLHIVRRQNHRECRRHRQRRRLRSLQRQTRTQPHHQIPLPHFNKPQRLPHQHKHHPLPRQRISLLQPQRPETPHFLL